MNLVNKNTLLPILVEEALVAMAIEEIRKTKEWGSGDFPGIPLVEIREWLGIPYAPRSIGNICRRLHLQTLVWKYRTVVMVPLEGEIRISPVALPGTWWSESVPAHRLRAAEFIVGKKELAVAGRLRYGWVPEDYAGPVAPARSDPPRADGLLDPPLPTVRAAVIRPGEVDIFVERVPEAPFNGREEEDLSLEDVLGREGGRE